jgi:hypothetical protein
MKKIFKNPIFFQVRANVSLLTVTLALHPKKKILRHRFEKRP